MSESISDYIDRYAVAICIILSIISLLFIIFGHRFRDQVQLALKREFIKLPATSFDWWSVSHFLLFGLFGLLIPDQHLSFFLLGTSFEVFEDALSGDNTTQLVDCTDCYNKENSLMCRFSINDDYWYGKWDDIFVNLLGYTVGSSIRTSLLK
jgi:hypothetical protein